MDSFRLELFLIPVGLIPGGNGLIADGIAPFLWQRIYDSLPVEKGELKANPPRHGLSEAQTKRMLKENGKSRMQMTNKGPITREEVSYVIGG